MWFSFFSISRCFSSVSRAESGSYWLAGRFVCVIVIKIVIITIDDDPPDGDDRPMVHGFSTRHGHK